MNELHRLREQIDHSRFEPNFSADAIDQLRSKALTVFEQVVIKRIQFRKISRKVVGIVNFDRAHMLAIMLHRILRMSNSRQIEVNEDIFAGNRRTLFVPRPRDR
jgi:hypothetical protein